jgi:hypothetical protein
VVDPGWGWTAVSGRLRSAQTVLGCLKAITRWRWVVLLLIEDAFAPISIFIGKGFDRPWSNVVRLNLLPGRFRISLP